MRRRAKQTERRTGVDVDSKGETTHEADSARYTETKKRKSKRRKSRNQQGEQRNVQNAKWINPGQG
jgi:hypothetical protein